MNKKYQNRETGEIIYEPFILDHDEKIPVWFQKKLLESNLVRLISSQFRNKREIEKKAMGWLVDPVSKTVYKPLIQGDIVFEKADGNVDTLSMDEFKMDYEELETDGIEEVDLRFLEDVL